MRRLLHRIAGGFKTMGELPAYFAATRRQWVDVAWGAGVPAVLFIILWSLDVIRNTRYILYFFIWALFMAGYYVWRPYHLRLIPKVEVRDTLVQHTPVQHPGSLIVDQRTFIQLAPKCLTEAPIYECRGYLREMRRWDPAQHCWETLDFRGLTFWWDNTDQEQITLYPGVEKPLDVVYIRHSDAQVIPCMVGDIPMQRIVDVFKKRAGAIEAYQFDIQLTGSDRIDGNLINLKPITVCVRVRTGDHPSSPMVDLISGEMINEAPR